ncbi:MAG TPA: hypothetical protein VGM90_32015 [Kofleriaceae bacterium]|jgi:hypothetical protein
MAETWVKCTECRSDIPYGTTYQQCSVSTCNRSRFPLYFCSVICWDAHMSTANHREAWAVEAYAPTKEAWAKEQAATVAPRPVAATPDRPAPSTGSAPVRRVVGDASPSTAAAVEGNVAFSSTFDRDVLIVVSKLKKYIKDRSGFNCSDAVAEHLSDHVRAVCDEAIRAAGRDERKTVLDRDVPKVRR